MLYAYNTYFGFIWLGSVLFAMWMTCVSRVRRVRRDLMRSFCVRLVEHVRQNEPTENRTCREEMTGNGEEEGGRNVVVSAAVNKSECHSVIEI